jgi:hypothetical protein
MKLIPPQASRHLQRAMLLLIRSANNKRRPGSSEAILLTPEKVSGVVGLIWALDISPDSAEVEKAVNSLGALDTCVLVTDTLDFTKAAGLGCMVEALPGKQICQAQPALDWQTYLERRIARIRYSWAPDVEVVVAQSPEEFTIAAKAG